MHSLINWIKQHKIITALTIIAAFAVPLLVVHCLFKANWGMQWLEAQWTPGELIGYIIGFEGFFAASALSVLALWQNEASQQEYIDSQEPILSMKLLDISGFLYLMIENTGATGATDICIRVTEICNNGNQSELFLDKLFCNTFELYPKESLQGRIATTGSNIGTEIFPQISVKISYIRSDIHRRNEYSRTVTYSTNYDSKIVADVNFDNRRQESDIDKIARGVVRIANYLDGHQVAKFDELDILAGRSFQNDLVNAIKEVKPEPIVSRDETIQKRIL